ncbi:MAG: hypothetical protein ABIP61_06220 [Burkholderiaceae bacterium]
MPHAQLISNPFALMMEPQAVFEAMQRSERLARLHSRICRPLDKPLLAQSDSPDADAQDCADVATDFGQAPEPY